MICYLNAKSAQKKIHIYSNAGLMLLLRIIDESTEGCTHSVQI